MDILAHGLWAGTAAKAANSKLKQSLKIKRAVFWGIFPDLLAFAVPFVWLFWNMIFNGIGWSDLPRPDAAEPAGGERLIFGNGDLPPFKKSIFYLTPLLYHLGHSVVVFLAAFSLIALFYRLKYGRSFAARLPWTMGGWFLHILIDIPTHSYRFYPTPFLWPLSEWKFNGFSWGTPWFLVLNYSLLAVVYWILWRQSRKRVVV